MRADGLVMAVATAGTVLAATLAPAGAADGGRLAPGVTPPELRAHVALPERCDLTPDGAGWTCVLADAPGVKVVLLLDDRIPVAYNWSRDEQGTLGMLRLSAGAEAVEGVHNGGAVADWRPQPLAAADRPEGAAACLINDWEGDLPGYGVSWRSRQVACARWLGKDLPQEVLIEVMELRRDAFSGPGPIDIEAAAIEIARRSSYPPAPVRE